jgi:hypothetical protein
MVTVKVLRKTFLTFISLQTHIHALVFFKASKAYTDYHATSPSKSTRVLLALLVDMNKDQKETI